MIYWVLFLTFLKVGVMSFGGGYGMISLLSEEVYAHGWMSEETFLNFIAVAESTPGPIAINMATFVGSTQGGFLGAFLATLGVTLPSFVIIILIVAILKNLLKFAGVQAFLGGIKPAVAGLITATAITILISLIFGIKNVGNDLHFEWRALVIFAIVACIGVGYKLWKKKSFSPILLILISAVLGIGFYAIPI